jgi:hypothetical protein
VIHGAPNDMPSRMNDTVATTQEVRDSMLCVIKRSRCLIVVGQQIEQQGGG